MIFWRCFGYERQVYASLYSVYIVKNRDVSEMEFRKEKKICLATWIFCIALVTQSGVSCIGGFQEYGSDDILERMATLTSYEPSIENGGSKLPEGDGVGTKIFASLKEMGADKSRWVLKFLEVLKVETTLPKNKKILQEEPGMGTIFSLLCGDIIGIVSLEDMHDIEHVNKVVSFMKKVKVMLSVFEKAWNWDSTVEMHKNIINECSEAVKEVLEYVCIERYVNCILRDMTPIVDFFFIRKRTIDGWRDLQNEVKVFGDSFAPYLYEDGETIIEMGKNCDLLFNQINRNMNELDLCNEREYIFVHIIIGVFQILAEIALDVLGSVKTKDEFAINKVTSGEIKQIFRILTAFCELGVKNILDMLRPQIRAIDVFCNYGVNKFLNGMAQNENLRPSEQSGINSLTDGDRGNIKSRLIDIIEYVPWAVGIVSKLGMGETLKKYNKLSLGMLGRCPILSLFCGCIQGIIPYGRDLSDNKRWEDAMELGTSVSVIFDTFRKAWSDDHTNEKREDVIKNCSLAVDRVLCCLRITEKSRNITLEFMSSVFDFFFLRERTMNEWEKLHEKINTFRDSFLSFSYEEGEDTFIYVVMETFKIIAELASHLLTSDKSLVYVLGEGGNLTINRVIGEEMEKILSAISISCELGVKNISDEYNNRMEIARRRVVVSSTS